ncbi:MAG: sigma-70 family RNA polymerase sigma factor [Chloroflexi bacterium]|nr:sigma-70 family RNA polymerase sigma factor [Chloroflexota bacterium]
MQTEAALVAALKQRDPAALATLFEQYSDRIYRLAVSVLHDEVQADGVVQNTFLTLIERVQDFEGRASIGTWLYRVAHNECLMRLRQAKPIVDLVEENDDAPAMPTHLVDWQTVPDTILSSSEAMTEMERAISRLKPDLRTVFVLRDIEELSTAQTAEILGVSENVVKVRLHRARLALREQLAAYFEERAR